MLINWVCRSCGHRVARLAVRGDEPQVAALTAQVGDGIIELDSAGTTMRVHILCEDCLETIDPEEESEIVFLRGPEIH